MSCYDHYLMRVWSLLLYYKRMSRYHYHLKSNWIWLLSYKGLVVIITFQLSGNYHYHTSVWLLSRSHNCQLLLLFTSFWFYVYITSVWFKWLVSYKCLLIIIILQLSSYDYSLKSFCVLLLSYMSLFIIILQVSGYDYPLTSVWQSLLSQQCQIIGIVLHVS